MSDTKDKSEIAKKVISEKFNEILEFRRALTGESDRGCALMAAAFLDSELEKLLSKYFVDNENVKKEVFGHSRPLGTFSSRIDLAYLLGLVGPKAHRDLHLIRKVRNEFGHVSTPITFDNPGLASRCSELYHHPFGKDASPKDKFIHVVIGVLGVVHAKLYSISVRHPFQM
ncbi:MAG TPA: MltR family transcriptional regulator, partial [Nitrososphaera sp.]|nr:MltR family transcriptional regulator [Nitrososphaera sp.]